MVHILLNQSNKEYSFPKVIIEVYFIFKTLTKRIKIKFINTIITFTLLSTIVYFIITIGSKLLTHYPQLEGSHIVFFGVVFSLILIMLFLEGTKDELKRTLRQFSFWLIIFLLLLGFSLTQINVYILPKLSNETLLSTSLILIGILFNFAQVLSTGRTAYSLALKEVNKEGIIERTYSEAFTYSKFLRIIGEYKSTQKQIISEIKNEIARIGLKKFLINMLPVWSIIIFFLFTFTILNLYSSNISNLFESILDFIINIWILLWGGDKDFAMSLFVLLLLFYFFFKQLSVLLLLFREKHLIPIFKQIEMMLLTTIIIVIFIDIILVNITLVNVIVVPLGIITILLGALLAFIEKLTSNSKNSNSNNKNKNNE
ncbi:hypothetical protein [Paraliobacillus ryukyuensis]|nr:hypothetical protein [Paraliobacillus ryukyuensis]